MGLVGIINFTRVVDWSGLNRGLLRMDKTHFYYIDHEHSPLLEGGMKRMNQTQHFENLKVNFRNRAKMSAYDSLVSLQWDVRRSLQRAKDELNMKQNEVRRLKKDFKALQSVIEEFKK